MTRALLVAAALLGALARPAAAQTAPRQPLPEPRPAGQTGGHASAADFVSLTAVREGLRRASGGATKSYDIYAAPVPPTAPRLPAAMPVYRAEVVAYRPTTFEDSLWASARNAWAPAQPGYLDGAPGTVRAGAPLVCGGVSVDPAIVVRLVQRWAHKRAVTEAKREVAEELDALLAAQAAIAKKEITKR